MSDNKLYDINFISNLAYELGYSDATNYTPKLINLHDLKLNLIKLTDYNLDNIFDKKIRFIETKPTGLYTEDKKSIDQYMFRFETPDNLQLLVTIVPYTDPTKIDDLTNPININQIMKLLLAEFIVNKLSNNLLLPVINIDVESSDLAAHDKINKYVEKHSFYSVQITEKFFKYMTLEHYIKKYPLNSKTMLSIISQAVDVLNIISSYYPNFRHNQFIPSMLDCYVKSEDDNIVPVLKLNNFYLAEIINVIDNSYVKKNNIPHIDTIYSDLYQLLIYLWSNNQLVINEDPVIVELFNAILPKSLRNDNEGYIDTNAWNMLPDEDKFNLRILNIKKMISSIGSQEKVIDKIGNYESSATDDLYGGTSETKTYRSESKHSFANIKSNKNNIMTNNKSKNAKKLNRIVEVHESEGGSEHVQPTKTPEHVPKSSVKKFKSKRIIMLPIVNQNANMPMRPQQSAPMQQQYQQSSQPSGYDGINSLGKVLGYNPNDMLMQQAHMSRQPMPQIPQQMPSYQPMSQQMPSYQSMQSDFYQQRQPPQSDYYQPQQPEYYQQQQPQQHPDIMSRYMATLSDGYNGYPGPSDMNMQNEMPNPSMLHEPGQVGTMQLGGKSKKDKDFFFQMNRATKKRPYR